MELDPPETRIGEVLKNSLILIKEETLRKDIRFKADLVDDVPKVMRVDER